jgi:hypothetical protein
MLGKVVRVLAVAAVAASLASPVAAHLYKKKQLDTKLTEIRGEVINLYRPKDQDEPTTIILLIKNFNHKNERQGGNDQTWAVSVDTRLMKAAGIAMPALIRDKEITIIGYRVEDDLCWRAAGNCPFAGRQLRFDDGCIVFVGREAPVFGRRADAWGWNVPDDGLENTDSSRC